MSGTLKHKFLKETEELARQELRRILKQKNIDIEQDPDIKLAIKRLLETHYRAKLVEIEIAF